MFIQAITLPIAGRPRLRWLARTPFLILAAILGAVVATVLIVGGGGEAVSVSSGGDSAGSAWVVPVPELPLPAGDVDLATLDIIGRTAGPTHQHVAFRGVDDAGREVLATAFWTRESRSEEWTARDLLVEPIVPDGLATIVRVLPATGETPSATYVNYVSEQWKTTEYILDYDTVDGAGGQLRLDAHHDGAVLPNAADDPAITVRAIPELAEPD